VNRPKRNDARARTHTHTLRPLRRVRTTDAENDRQGPEIINDLNAVGIKLDYWVTGYGE
jgi:hypothetical protein